MNFDAVMPALLLLLFLSAVTVGGGMGLLIFRVVARHRARSEFPPQPSLESLYPSTCASYLRRPASWLAIKSRSVMAVQSALGLHNPKPCSWTEGLAGEDKLF